MLAENQELAAQPILLAARDARRGMLVRAASKATRQAGIRVGMKLSEARALAPESTVLPHEPDDDLDALCHLCESAQMFSPIVGIEQLGKDPWAGRPLFSPQALLLDVTGVAPLFGGEQQLCSAMSNYLQQQHLFGCIAIAPTIGSAWAAANWGLRSAPPSQDTNASEESELTTPASWYQVVEDVGDLDTLPAESMRLDVKTIEQLHKLGCRTIADVKQLPRSGVANRLGATLLKRSDQLVDPASETVVTHAASEAYQFHHALEYPTEDVDILAESLRRLCHQLGEKLSKSSDGALRLVCLLEQLAAPPVLIQIGFFRPTQDPVHLSSLLCGQLNQQLARTPVAAVQRTVLQATLTAPLVWRQADLFDQSPGATDAQIASLVDSLSARMGRGRVLAATVRRDAQPEFSFAFRPLTGLRRTGTAQDTGRKISSRLATRRAEPSPTDPLRRPTHLLNPPIEIELRTVTQHAQHSKEYSQQSIESQQQTAPQQRSDAESKSAGTQRLQFFYRQNWHTVVSREGPERLESGWWKGPSARRDYYRFVTADGCWWWVYRDMTDSRWFLHGQFD